MKFNFRVDRKSLIKIGLILVLLAILPFSMEMVLLIDIGGIDFALSFLVIYLGTLYNTILVKWDAFKRELRYLVVFLGELYMFKPRVLVPHVAVSSIVVSVTCSLFLACLFWIPLMYVSSGFIT